MTLRLHAEALYDSIRRLLGNHDATQVQHTLERELRHVVPMWSDTKPDSCWSATDESTLN